MRSDDVKGWGGGGVEAGLTGRGDTTQLVHAPVQQKRTHCKAIIFHKIIKQYVSVIRFVCGSFLPTFLNILLVCTVCESVHVRSFFPEVQPWGAMLFPFVRVALHVCRGPWRFGVTLLWHFPSSLDALSLCFFEMAAHSSTPAWRIPRIEEPGGLQSMGSHRVGHD